MGWATCTHGHLHWGRRGAAGLLLADGGRVLLQLRAGWTHRGGTWSIPGGALERGEAPVDAALREAAEELAVRTDQVAVRASYVARCGGWSYETVLAVPASDDLHLADRAESLAHTWATPDEVTALPLHPAFRDAWDAPDGELRDFVAATVSPGTR